ncbi:hypothetical protein CDAR_484101 [Caerostris darwini]|uniref:Uncharacterized protein n=1 Tax=Caerostris darwini TaxID=1538125 RepID=A0AAV4T8M0_9ARAC|nr:hypothetical protein CDAR_484101 [Caerostris darwini]
MDMCYIKHPQELVLNRIISSTTWWSKFPSKGRKTPMKRSRRYGKNCPTGRLVPNRKLVLRGTWLFVGVSSLLHKKRRERCPMRLPPLLKGTGRKRRKQASGQQAGTKHEKKREEGFFSLLVFQQKAPDPFSRPLVIPLPHSYVSPPSPTGG